MANKNSAYPSTDAVKRPFRIWVAKGKPRKEGTQFLVNTYIPHRYYSEVIRAHRAAWLEAGWAAAGVVLEVVDARTGKLHGQYRVHPDNRVTFWR